MQNWILSYTINLDDTIFNICKSFNQFTTVALIPDNCTWLKPVKVQCGALAAPYNIYK